MYTHVYTCIHMYTHVAVSSPEGVSYHRRCRRRGCGEGGPLVPVLAGTVGISAAGLPHATSHPLVARRVNFSQNRITAHYTYAHTIRHNAASIILSKRSLEAKVPDELSCSLADRRRPAGGGSTPPSSRGTTRRAGGPDICIYY